VALASKALLLTTTLLTIAGRSRSYPHQIQDTIPSGTPLANTGANNYLLPSPFLSLLSVMTRIIHRRFFKCSKNLIFFSIPHLDLQACSFIYISTIDFLIPYKHLSCAITFCTIPWLPCATFFPRNHFRRPSIVLLGIFWVGRRNAGIQVQGFKG
jgi:hypothetical protein